LALFPREVQHLNSFSIARRFESEGVEEFEIAAFAVAANRLIAMKDSPA
jgi:hypothetical protein